jgi:hypothetical protein
MSMKRILVALSLVAASFASPAHAAPKLGGCVAIQGSNCRYVATGPGWFAGTGPAVFKIQATTDGGKTWRILAYSPGGTPKAGPLNSMAGEVVDVSVGMNGPCAPGLCDPGFRVDGALIAIGEA